MKQQKKWLVFLLGLAYFFTIGGYGSGKTPNYEPVTTLKSDDYYGYSGGARWVYSGQETELVDNGEVTRNYQYEILVEEIIDPEASPGMRIYLEKLFVDGSPIAVSYIGRKETGEGYAYYDITEHIHVEGPPIVTGYNLDYMNDEQNLVFIAPLNEGEETIIRRTKARVESYEDVDLPIGQIKVYRVHATYGSDEVPNPKNGEVNLWIVPYIGLVRVDEEWTTDEGTVTQFSTTELISYTNN